jgi:hypothetical protein
MKNKLNKASLLLFHVYLKLCLCWIFLALGMQVFFIYLEFSGQEERMSRYANEFEWKFDGTFKDYPGNIMYEAPTAKK